jgi:hypothetical protein
MADGQNKEKKMFYVETGRDREDVPQRLLGAK